jgi:putative aldouronate transport system permease protein
MRNSISENFFNFLIIIILLILTLSFLLPFIIVLSTSLISELEWAERGGHVLYPKNLSFAAYEILFGKSYVLFNAYQVTFLRVTLGTFCNMIFTTSLAYALAQKDLPGRIPLTFLVFFTMIFNGGLIPHFLLVDFLNLRNTIFALFVPTLINGWYLLIMRNFFMKIPRDLVDAAIIDGASPFKILVNVVLPLSMPVIATISLFYAVYHWNEWFYASIYISENDMKPMQIILRGLLNQATMQGIDNISFMEEPPPAASLRSALIIFSTVPILLVYPFIQRYFIKGIMVGGVKG